MSEIDDELPSEYDESKLNQIDEALREITEHGGPPYSLIGTPAAFFGSDLLFKTQEEAKAAFLNLEKLFEDLDKAFDSFSDNQKIRISADCARNARKAEELSVGKIGAIQGIIPSFKSLIEALTPGLNTERERIKTELMRYGRTGRAPNFAARQVALAIAEIFMREQCEIPTTGTKPNSSEPSTPYSRVVQKVFDILDIRIGFRSPTKYAIAQVRDTNLTEFKNQRRRRKAIRRAMSLSRIS